MKVSLMCNLPIYQERHSIGGLQQEIYVYYSLVSTLVYTIVLLLLLLLLVKNI